jgi:hypothetical protein
MPIYCEHGIAVDGGDFLDSKECQECQITHSRQSKYNKASQDRKREAGLIKVERWIHGSRKAEFDALVRELQKPKGEK